MATDRLRPIRLLQHDTLLRNTQIPSNDRTFNLEQKEYRGRSIAQGLIVRLTFSDNHAGLGGQSTDGMHLGPDLADGLQLGGGGGYQCLIVRR